MYKTSNKTEYTSNETYDGEHNYLYVIYSKPSSGACRGTCRSVGVCTCC